MSYLWEAMHSDVLLYKVTHKVKSTGNRILKEIYDRHVIVSFSMEIGMGSVTL